MSKPSRERISESRRRILGRALFPGPGEAAAYWSTFFSELMDRFLGNSGRPSEYLSDSPLDSILMPGVEITEEKDEVIVTIDMPDYRKENMNIRILDNVLYVSATRVIDAESDKIDTHRVYWASRPRKYHRSIWLPVPVEPEANVTAKYDDGSLRIRIPLMKSATVTID